MIKSLSAYQKRHFAKIAALFALFAIFFALFAAGCNVGSDDGYTQEKDAPFDKSTKQFDVILPAAGVEGGIAASPESAKLGTVVTLNYVPPESSGTEDGVPAESVPAGNATAENAAGGFAVTALTGSYYDGQETVDIIKTGDGGWKFSMPAADVFISAEYGEYVESGNANLKTIVVYANNSEAARAAVDSDSSDYTVTVPYGAETVRIAAVTEDIQAFSTLSGGSGNPLEFLQDIELAEGVNSFAITVTAGDGRTEKTYNFVIKRKPDLSLKTFAVTGAVNTEYTKELESKTRQMVTVTEQDVRIIAEPFDERTEVSGDAGEPFSVTSSKYITKAVRVSREFDGEVYGEDYVVNICYSTNSDAVGSSLPVTLMYNYESAKNGGIYRTIIIPLIGNDETGDILTLSEGLEEAGANIERGHYEFTGWFDTAAGGAEFDPSVNLVYTAKTLYAGWVPVEYTLTLEYNYPENIGGGGGVSPYKITINGNCEAPFSEPDEPELENYNFEGWYTKADGGVLYELPQNLTETRTVYARWSGKVHKITFDAGEGAVPRSQRFDVAYPGKLGDIEGAVTAPVKASYGFDGWVTGGDNIAFDAEIAPEGDMTYRAEWTQDVYSVKFYKNCQTGESAYLTVSFGKGSGITLPDSLLREGYLMTGWSDSGGDPVVNGAPVTADMEIYAQWFGITEAKANSNALANAEGGAISYAATAAGFDEIHTFTTDGTFKFKSDSREVRALIVAGGGGGGGGDSTDGGGGGGAGGLLEVVAAASTAGMTVTVGTVGTGGGGSTATGGSGGNGTSGSNGGNSSFNGITAKGGGGGAGGGGSSGIAGKSGGSGGGGGAGGGSSQGAGGDETLNQGHKGGSGGTGTGGGGGGGAGGAGSEGIDSGGGLGGTGKTLSYYNGGVGYIYARGGDGGGGGATDNSTYGSGGKGGKKGASTSTKGDAGSSGLTGVVVIRFPYKL